MESTSAARINIDGYHTEEYLTTSPTVLIISPQEYSIRGECMGQHRSEGSRQTVGRLCVPKVNPVQS